MPRQEFVDLVHEIKTTGQGRVLSKRDFIYLFGYYQKRTSGNVWRINEYLRKEKMKVTPSYQNGWIDEKIELREKDKARISNGEIDEERFDPINRLSVLESASKTPISVKRDDTLEKVYHLLWKNEISQLPVMNDDRTLLGIISWETIAKGLISKKESKSVKDFMRKDFTVLDENIPLFDAIKHVIKSGFVFVQDKEKKIKGPVTRLDLNTQFIDQIEPYILLEQIENFIRLILHDKIILDDILKLLNRDEDNRREIESISDLNFGEYLLILSNNQMWETINLPFDKALFVNELDEVRKIRNSIMHFHPDRTPKTDLKLLKKISKFLMDFV